MKKTKLLVCLAMVLVCLGALAMPAFAASGWMSECKPYQYTSATEYAPTSADGFTVGGKEYYEGYVFYNWYQTSLSQALYNLKGEYKTFEFDIGRVDGTTVAPSKLYVYKEGLIDEEIDLSATALKTHIKLDVEGVDSLKLICETQGHYYDVYYGVFNGKWTASGKTAAAVKSDAWIDDCPPYEASNAEFFYNKDDRAIVMAGDEYGDAVRMYLWNPARTATISYNLNNNYKSFSFVFGHVDNTTRAHGTLTVKLDGEIVKTVTLHPDSLPVPVKVNLTGADQMILELTSSNALNTYDIYYGIGNGKFVSKGAVNGVYLNDSEITFSADKRTHQLKADVRPRDAKNKKVTWTSSDTSVATVSSNGKVMAVGAGTAEIKVTTADGEYEAVCKVTAPEGVNYLKIGTQPKTTYTKSGKMASVCVGATGDGLKYQWYVKNAGASSYVKSSVTTAAYSVKMNSTTKNRLAYCVVTDRYGVSVKTKTVVMRMAATITSQPKSVTVAKGVTAKVTVGAVGDGLTYRWYYKNAGSSGYTYTDAFKGKTYSVAMNSSRNGRQVLCRVYDKYGNMVQSNAVKLVMKNPLKITKQPVSVTVAKGKTAKVTFKATGDGLIYRWYYKDRGMSSYTRTDSFKGNSYSMPMTAARNGRQVLCRVYDKYGNVVQTKAVSLRMK